MGHVTVLGPGDTAMGNRLSGGPQSNLYGSPSISKEEVVSARKSYARGKNKQANTQKHPTGILEVPAEVAEGPGQCT